MPSGAVFKVTSADMKSAMAAKSAAAPRSGPEKTAVVAIGSFAGHKGHEKLFNYTIKRAQELNADPYLFIGNAVGVDDPIPPQVKVQTWHKLFPKYAANISAVIQGGSIMQKIKHELIAPAPGKLPKYDNIIITVGEDRKDLPLPAALMKSVNKFPGYEHVKVTLETIPRSAESMSFTKLRNILKDPAATPEQQMNLWSQGFSVDKLGRNWVQHLMSVTKQGMNIKESIIKKHKSTKLYEQLLQEGTSLETTIRAILNDISEPIAQYYATVSEMARKYAASKGHLDGFGFIMGSAGTRWFDTFYFNKLQKELFHLVRYAPAYTKNLKSFLDTSPTKFSQVERSLPGILEDIGQRAKLAILTKKAQNWMRLQQEFADLRDELDSEEREETPAAKQASAEKAKATQQKATVGSQMSQVEQIVSNVLASLPPKVAGEIRNAISRSGNKLQALQQELTKRGIKM